ncbi:hypothetical protein EIP86_005164 [Pleurotus ostreatoroseus]|nr:hypothetical protein EIP86_005164 [Pleurotus ostreatoroseus]
MSPASSSFGGLSASRPSALSSVSNPSASRPQASVQYAQLLEEARSTMDIGAEVSTSIAEGTTVIEADHNGSANSSTSSSVPEEPSTPSNSSQDFEEANRSHITPLLPGPPSLSFAGKMKDLVFSYLPRFSRGSTEQAPLPQEPEPPKGLPVPPPEVFQKPRPPIKTPLPKVAPKPPHPKDLVRLHPPASKPSMIPRPTQTQSQGQNLRRLVELHSVPPKASTSTGTHPVDIPRSRRDSTASVKDLVKSFESMEKLQAAERESFRHLDLKRKRSIQEWTKAKAGNPKPSWRPYFAWINVTTHNILFDKLLAQERPCAPAPPATSLNRIWFVQPPKTSLVNVLSTGR